MISDVYLVTDEDVLAERDALTNAGPTTNMHKVPDTRPFANLRPIIDNGAGMLVMTHGSTQQVDEERMAFVVVGRHRPEGANVLDRFHAVACALDAVALAIQDGLVADGM